MNSLLLPEKPLSIIFILLFFPITIQAASFDCTKAKSELEKLICNDHELSKQDDSMNEAYLKALNRTDIKEQAIQSQKEWLKYVRNVFQKAECIKTAHESRIKELGLMSSFGIVIFRDPNRKPLASQSQPKVSKQERIRFGAPVKADADTQASKKLLPLAFSPPFNSRELATNAEIILVSGYKPANRNTTGATVNVEINRPGSKVLLILTSCIKVDWQVTPHLSQPFPELLQGNGETKKLQP
jgi:uncharacterized protein